MVDTYTLDNLARRLSGIQHTTWDAYISHMRNILIPETITTLYMVGFASLFVIIFGLVLGVFMYIIQPGGIHPLPWLYKLISIVVNIGRSIPIVVLIMLVFPLARVIVGPSIGPTAAIVPLTIAAVPFMSRVVESALNELGHGIIEAALAAGANTPQIIFRVLLPESAPALVAGFTLTIINLVAFSAMAGMIGARGLGHIAVSYGHQRFRSDILMYTIVLLVVIVQVVQAVGSYISRKLDKR